MWNRKWLAQAVRTKTLRKVRMLDTFFLVAWWKGDSVAQVWTLPVWKWEPASGNLLSPKESRELSALIWGWAGSWEINLRGKPSRTVAELFPHLVPMCLGVWIRSREPFWCYWGHQESQEKYRASGPREQVTSLWERTQEQEESNLNTTRKQVWGHPCYWTVVRLAVSPWSQSARFPEQLTCMIWLLPVSLNSLLHFSQTPQWSQILLGFCSVLNTLTWLCQVLVAAHGI